MKDSNQILKVTTRSGNQLTLAHCGEAVLPSRDPAAWLAFQGPHIMSFSLDTTQQNAVQRYMRQHRTEVLTNGHAYLTLAGGHLALCAPERLNVSAAALFIGVFPCGISYSDRTREKSGDYLKVAFLDYRTLTLTFLNPCAPSMRALIEEHARALTARRGEAFSISSCGQTVILGAEST